MVFPSECYETFGRVAVEAFAKGTPVIASNHGAPADVVDANRTGLLFKPGDPADLAHNVRSLLADPNRLAQMRREARAEYEAHYTGERAHQQLIEIYNQALSARSPRAPSPPCPPGDLMSTPLITTSWDDGHPHDFRIAELLSKYKLTGTFYIPRNAPTGVMSPAHVRDLASSFEIGAHTLDHVFLPDVPDIRADEQIAGSKKWVEDVTGKPCPLFCPPAGKLHHHHIRLIRIAGFLGLRTVEFMSLDPPRSIAGMLIMPTTLQACPHGAGVYLRNFAKRFALRNLWLWITTARSTAWANNVRDLLAATLRRGGVFHLWGHSWEITEHAQWDRLEYAFKLMSEVLDQAPCLTNGEICRRALAASESGAALLTSAPD